MENNEFKKFRTKKRKCYYFDDIINLEDFDLDNILIEEKSHENILIYENILIQNQRDGFIGIYDGTKYLTFLAQKNMKLFAKESDML